MTLGQDCARSEVWRPLRVEHGSAPQANRQQDVRGRGAGTDCALQAAVPSAAHAGILMQSAGCKRGAEEPFLSFG